MPINYDRDYVMRAMYGAAYAGPIEEPNKGLLSAVWGCVCTLWAYFTIYD